MNRSVTGTYQITATAGEHLSKGSVRVFYMAVCVGEPTQRPSARRDAGGRTAWRGRSTRLCVLCTAIPHIRTVLRGFFLTEPRRTQRKKSRNSHLCVLCVSVRRFPFDLVWSYLHRAKRIFRQSAKTCQRRRRTRAKDGQIKRKFCLLLGVLGALCASPLVAAAPR